jgi:hypothetical protein
MPPQPTTFSLPPITDAKSLVSATGSLAAALSSGQVAGHETSASLASWGVYQRALETQELAQRIAALETAAAVKGA